ncbi:hypothetical protein DV735_g187, partial [Chaetothyriales sp. CBS 134920]
MSVDLHPSELGFRRPFDHEVSEVLTLANNNTAPVAFKVKTTAPKQSGTPSSRLDTWLIDLAKWKSKVGVKPSCLDDSALTWPVLLQAMKEDPPLDARCRDKFLVQSVLVDESLDPNLSTLWQQVEKTSKGSIQERKIRVNYLAAAGATTNGVGSEEERPPAYASPTPQFGSPATDAKSSTVASTGGSAKELAAQAGVATGAAGVGAAIATRSSPVNEDLKAQLAAAQERVAALSKQVQDLQQKPRESQGKVQTIQRTQEAAGVPLQITAALCLISFIIAYLFF